MKIPILSKFLERRSQISNLKSPKKWLLDALLGRQAITGIIVNEQTAMQYTAIYSCIRIISESIASLPLFTYKRLEQGREKAYDHPLYELLHILPNSEITSFTYREVMMVHLLLNGNSFSEISKDAKGNILELWPLLPRNMKVERIGGVLVYTYTLPNGQQTIIPNKYILHIPGLGYDGIIGMSPIAFAREAIGLGLALEEFGERFFEQGTNIGGVVSHPGKLSDKAYDRLKGSLSKKYKGLGKSHRLMILEEAMKFSQVTIPPNEAQFIQARKFQLEEIARIYRVPLHLLQNLDKASFANIEHQSIDFVVHTLRPWLVRIEQAFLKDLFKPRERREYFAEHLVEGLLRGDIESRYNAYNIARMGGWMNADDICELENRNPLPEGQGKIYLVPLNMIDVKTLVSQAKEEKTPKAKEKKILAIINEKRSKNSMIIRARLTRSYKGLFVSATERIVKREKADILRAAKKIFVKRDINLFNDFLDEFYRKHPAYIKKQTKPVFLSFSKEIQAAVAEEINSKDDMSAQLDKFMEEYQDIFSQRYIGKSKALIINAIKRITDKRAIAEDEIIAELEEEFNKWEKERTEEVAKNEAVKINGAVAVFTFTMANILIYYWHAVGSKPCTYCLALDGQSVGTGGTFIPAGVDFNPVGADGSLKIRGPKMHPPLHGGCECQISAS